MDNNYFYRGVAQLGRALGSGLRGQEFESPHPDQEKINNFLRSPLKGFNPPLFDLANATPASKGDGVCFGWLT